MYLHEVTFMVLTVIKTDYLSTVNLNQGFSKLYDKVLKQDLKKNYKTHIIQLLSLKMLLIVFHIICSGRKMVLFIINKYCFVHLYFVH